MSERTRQFKATYTSNDNKKHVLNVRVFKRLASFGLALAMVGSMTGCRIAPVGPEPEPTGTVMDNPDMALVDSIVKGGPDRLKVVTQGEYTVDYFDTISSIAEANGNTVKRICELNGIKEDTTIRVGQTLKVETIKRLDELDAETVILESYFSDYLFNTPLATFAKNYDGEEDQMSGIERWAILYRDFLYGDFIETGELDQNGVLGQYWKIHGSYHNEDEIPAPSLEGESLEDRKRTYVDSLRDLASEVDSELNSVVNLITPYSKYKVYFTNGTTKYDEVQPVSKTIYK